MGEAKRRHRRAGEETTTPCTDPRTGENYGFARWAGYRLTEYFDLAWNRWAKGEAVTDVPCQGCTACCYYHEVPLQPEETGEGLDIVIAPDGDRVLKKRDDGACVHLGPAGCTVYEHRPRACCAYDCRQYAMAGLVDSYDSDRRSPGWVFEMSTPRDRTVMLGLQLGAASVVLGGGDQWCAGDALTAALQAMPENFPKAQKFIAEFDKLSPDQRRAIGAELEEGFSKAEEKAKAAI
jgi:hypothetical protein